MKKCLTIFLAMVILLLPCGIVVNAENNSSENSKNMLIYLNDKDNDLLIKRSNYAYMKLGEKWYSDVGVNYCLQMADLLIDTGSRPDKEKYMEVLINIIATYDMDNAADLSSQKKQDNLKSLKDYGMDAASLATDAISVYSGLEGIKGELSNAQEALSKAIDGVSVLIDNTNNWIDALTNLETFTQDYSNYNSFLKCVEDNADGELKNAASSLRNSMKQAFLLKLEAYSNVSSENFNNYTKFFFDDVFFDAVKSFDEYQTDKAFRFFVDSGEGLYEIFNILEDSWELGKDIGKLIGNITVGGENLINRTLEIEALYDISVILQTKLLDTTTEFLSHSADNDTDEYIEEYVTFANFLIGCRIRGEYCTYTILAEDSGLLSLLSDKTDAKNWYNDQSSAIIRLKNRINSIKKSNISNQSANEDMYAAYLEEVKALINKYGTGKIADDTSGNSAYKMTGLCYAKLIDFDNDGNEELLCVYGPTTDGTGYEKPCYMKVFGYDGSNVNTLFESSAFYFGESRTDRGYRIAYCEDNGQTLLLTRKNPMTFVINEWGRLSGNSFETVKSISDYNEADPGNIKYTVDNKEVSKADFDKQLSEWTDKQNYVLFNSDSRDSLESNITETTETLKTLGYVHDAAEVKNAEDLINSQVKDIAELMGGSIETTDDPFSFGSNYFYNDNAFPGMKFFVNITDYNSDFISDIKNNSVTLMGIQVEGGGAGFKHGDTLVTADMNYSQLSEILGTFKCKRSLGYIVNGVFEGVGTKVETDKCTVEINFDINWDISKYLSDDIEVPESEMREHNPKIKNIIVKKI